MDRRSRPIPAPEVILRRVTKKLAGERDRLRRDAIQR
jgi:hypothetical protein